MRHLSIALAIALGAACAHGARADEWTGADKQQHAAAGMAIAAGVSALSRDPLAGFVAGCGAGMAKELADAGRVFRAEAKATAKDLIVTCIGAAAGAASVAAADSLLGRLQISPIRGGAQVIYRTTF
jgi:hypothetical protein